MTNYAYDCTGDVVAGDIIKFDEAVFGAYSRRGRNAPLGQRTIEAAVLADSYGADKQQHTFTLRVIRCTGLDPIAAGTTIRRKGRNIYRNGVHRRRWDDEGERLAALAEKHGRGDAARMERASRRFWEG